MKRAADGPARLVAVHGNRFILYRVFKTVDDTNFDREIVDTEEQRAYVEEKAELYLNEISEIVSREFEGVFITGLFKSGEQSKRLDALLPSDPDTKRSKGATDAKQRSLFDT